jgi:hypothetical protein
MKDSIIQKLKNEGTLKLYLDFRSGDTSDRSGNNNTVTQAGGMLNRKGFQSIANSQSITVTSLPGFGTTATIITGMDRIPDTLGLTRRFFSTASYTDGVGLGTTNNLIWNDPSTKALSGTLTGSLLVGLQVVNGVNPMYYRDGIYQSTSGSSCLFDFSAAQNWVICSRTTGSNFLDSTMPYFLVISRVLTATEHAQVYAELSQMKWPTKPLTLASSNNVLYGKTKNIHLEGSPISVAARGGAIGQYLENTPFQFGDATARYSVSTGTVFGKKNVKTIKCNTAGLLYMPSSQAYGEWTFDLNKAAATAPKIQFCSSVIGAYSATAQNAYMLWVDANEVVYLQPSTNGSLGAALWATAAAYIADSTWYKFKITRSALNVFTTWIKGGAFTGWTLIVPASGTNPVTNNVNITSTYFILIFGVNDQIANLTFKPLA